MNIDKKLKKLSEVSNIDTVKQLAKKYNLGDVYPSKNYSKKYMIINPYTQRFVHFGDINYEDFTKHKDIDRKLLFRIRNKKWATAKKYTPAFLSYYLLW
jgi:hypothetical protein